MFTGSKLKSRFINHLMAENRRQLGNLARWVFQPGMLFQATETWWGKRRPRPSPHEGLDLCTFAESDGSVRHLEIATRIPAALAGTVAGIVPDFCGSSLFLRHEGFDRDGRRLYTAYGHTDPLESLTIGQTVAAGEIIAQISRAFGQKNTVLPHLHLTFAWIPASVEASRLNWTTLAQDRAVTLLDPLPALFGDWLGKEERLDNPGKAG